MLLTESELIDISIVIPAYNEELRILPTLEKTLRYASLYDKKFEIIVVDDGSSDSTSSIVSELSNNHPQVFCLSYPENQGKGFAVQFGVMNSKGKLILYMDADGSTPIEEFLKLYEEMKRSRADIVIGSRALFDQSSSVKTVWYRKLIGRIFNNLVNIILVPEIKDTQCGFKLFNRSSASKIFPTLTSKGFAFDCEVLFKAQKLNLKIREVSVNWTNVSGSKVDLFKHPISMLFDILRLRFSKNDITRSSSESNKGDSEYSKFESQ